MSQTRSAKVASPAVETRTIAKAHLGCERKRGRRTDREGSTGEGKRAIVETKEEIRAGLGKSLAQADHAARLETSSPPPFFFSLFLLFPPLPTFCSRRAQTNQASWRPAQRSSAQRAHYALAIERSLIAI